jgi:serine/threonine-protein kinase
MPILTPEERVGTTLGGKYRIERILAQGGMGTVFVGLHEWTHRPVAVKVLNYEHAREPEIVRRFLLEARAAAQLKHANVVDVLDMGQESDGSVYLVLELLEGETLKARMKEGPLALLEIVEVLGPIMRALATAHRKGVVHRDLKPDNIFLAIDESGQRVPKLLDFGIAKIGGGDSSSTRTGTMVGTPHFMAPEQVRGERDVGPAADVWSMGVVLYACFSGRLPFESDSTAGVLAKVITERPTPLLAVAPHLPTELGALVDRALQPRPHDRFADMAEMLAALSAAVTPHARTVGSPALESLAPPTPAPQDPMDLEGPPTVQRAMSAIAAPDATPIASPRRSMAKPLALGLGALAVLGVVGGGAFAVVHGGRTASSEDPDSEVPLIDVSRPATLIEPVSGAAPVDTAPAELAPLVEAPLVEAPPDVVEPAAPVDEPAVEPVIEPPVIEPVVEPVVERIDREPERAPRAAREPRRAARGTRGALILR